MQGAGLLVELDEGRAGRRGTPSAIAAQWYAQDVFAGLDDEDDEDDGVRTVDGDGKKRKRGQEASTPQGMKGNGSGKEEAEVGGEPGRFVRAPPSVDKGKGGKDAGAAADVWGEAGAWIIMITITMITRPQSAG
jgi:hypothetical protein